MNKKSEKSKGGRPQIPINEEELKKLAMMGCTTNEMAAFFNCSGDTLERRFAGIIKEGREKGKSSVRRMLWKHGDNGNSMALKYLIHNVLKEKLEDQVAFDAGGIQVVIKDYKGKNEA